MEAVAAAAVLTSHPDVLSVGVRAPDGRLVLVNGAHEAEWVPDGAEKIVAGIFRCARSEVDGRRGPGRLR
jgi:hypothetical protein